MRNAKFTEQFRCKHSKTIKNISRHPHCLTFTCPVPLRSLFLLAHNMADERTDPRIELRALNARAAAGETVLLVSGKTDSSLKKNTSFVKKVRAVSADNVAQVLADVRALSLEKYLSEISVSLSESLVNVGRSDDSMAYLQVMSALYQRFSQALIAPVLSSLVNFLVAKNSAELLARHKFVLRIVFNMSLVGLCSTLADCSADLLSDAAAKLARLYGQQPLCVPLLKSFMVFEPRLGHSLVVVSSFARTFKDMLLASGPADAQLLPERSREAFLQLLTLYTNEIVKSLVQLRNKTFQCKDRLRKVSIRTGKLLEDLQEDVDAAQELQEIFETNARTLCDVVGVPFPEPEEPETLDDPQPHEPGSEPQNLHWWDDAQDRDFHTVFPTEKEIDDAVDNAALSNLGLDSLTEGERVVKFLALLENSASENDLLTCSVVMKYVPYNRATRNKLLKFFLQEAKNSDSVSWYARFLKINEEYLAEVITDLTAALDQGFRSQLHHGRINFRTVAFFVELVKFKLIPIHVVFHKIRRLTLDLAGTNNAAILLVFYQDCGKFLLFESEYLETTKDMLELLKQRSKSASLSPDEKHVIGNLFLVIDSYINPRLQTPVNEAVISPIKSYISQIIRVLATPEHHRSASKLFQEVDFLNDIEARDVLYTVFQQAEELNSESFPLLAKLFYDSGKKRRFLFVRIVNGLVEQVHRGLERNDYRDNIARTAQVKLLASFYNERLLNVQSIIDLLFRLVCYGHPNNLPTPTSACEIDGPGDYFRLFLCGFMLKELDFELIKSTGYFVGSVKSLEGFLVFMQYYSYCKASPLPKDLKLVLRDVFKKFEAALGDEFDSANNFSDAAAIFQAYTLQCRDSCNKAVESNTKAAPNSALEFQEEDQSSNSESTEPHETSSDESTDNSCGEEAAGTEKSANSVCSSDCDESKSSESESDSDNDDYMDEEEEQKRMEEHIKSLKLADEKKVAAELDKAIQELRQEATLTSKPSRSLRMPAPSTFAARTSGASSADAGMKLNFLTRSNKLKELNMPSSLLLKERILKEQEERRANQMKVLSLVNKMNEAQ